jgi:hypothetical protein
MALQIRRGTNAERQLFTPLQGELVFTTDTKKLYVGDGSTAGGVAVDSLSGGGDTNTTYTISAETVSGGANLRLTGSDSSVDNVTLAAGSNVTVTRSDANTITIASTATGGGAVTLDELTDVVITGTPTTGQVIKWNGTNWVNGTDAVGTGGGAATLDELGDVVISGTPTTGQVLKFNGTNWVNGADDAGTGGATNLDGLTDVVLSGTPTTGQVLKFNGTNWENGTDDVGLPPAPPALDELSNVIIIPGILAAGQVLKYDGENWTNDTDATSGGGSTLDALSDVVITGTPVADQVVKWNGFNWVNGDPIINFSDVAGIALNEPANGQALIYDGVLGSWVNRTEVTSLNNLTDVVITGTPTSGQVLTWNGTNWGNAANTAPSVNDLSDVTLTLGLTQGQFLKYVGAGGWENASLGLADLADFAINPGTLAANQVLTWNGTDWANQALSIDSLNEVIIGGIALAAGHVLEWNGVSWVNGPVNLSGSYNIGLLDDASNVVYNPVDASLNVGDIDSNAIIINKPTSIGIALSILGSTFTNVGTGEEVFSTGIEFSTRRGANPLTPVAVATGDTAYALIAKAYNSVDADYGLSTFIESKVGTGTPSGTGLTAGRLVFSTTDGTRDPADAAYQMVLAENGTLSARVVEAGVAHKLPVYATTGARDTAIPTPAVGMMVFVTSVGMQVRGATAWNTVAGTAT